MGEVGERGGKDDVGVVGCCPDEAGAGVVDTGAGVGVGAGVSCGGLIFLGRPGPRRGGCFGVDVGVHFSPDGGGGGGGARVGVPKTPHAPSLPPVTDIPS